MISINPAQTLLFKKFIKLQLEINSLNIKIKI